MDRIRKAVFVCAGMFVWTVQPAGAACPEARRIAALGPGGCEYCTIQEAIDAEPGGQVIYLRAPRAHVEPEIHVDRDVTLVVADEFCDPSGIPGFPFFVNPVGATRVMTIQSGISVTMAGLILAGGDAGGGDGGILRVEANADVTLTDVLLSVGQADRGGCLWMGAGSSVMGIGLGMQACSANEGGGAYVQGFDFVQPSALILAGNSTVARSSASATGGGVHIVGHGSLLDLRDEASIGPPAIGEDGDQNQAAASGGGIYARSADVALSDDARVQFGVAEQGDGGCIANVDGGVVNMFQRAQILACFAGGAGGGVAVGEFGQLNMLAEASVSQAVATGDGGCVALGPRSELEMSEDTEVRSCVSELDGGAVHVGPEARMVMSQQAMLDTNLARSGGSVYVGGGGLFRMEGTSMIIGSSALADGGAVAAVGGDVALASQALIQGGFAMGDGGNVSLAGATLDLTDAAALRDGRASGSGGAIAARAGSAVRLDGPDVLVSGGEAMARGHGVYLAEGSALDVAESAVLSGNGVLAPPAVSGSGIYSEDSFVRLMGDALVTLNRGAFGGGVHLVGGTLDLLGCSALFDNTALEGGGGVYADGAVVTFDGSAGCAGPASVDSNHAVGMGGGGGLQLVGDARLVAVGDTAIARNDAVTVGGAIDASDDAIVELGGDVVVSDNQAGTGGGAALSGRATLVMAERAALSANGVTDPFVGRGAGAAVRDLAQLTMRDFARIADHDLGAERGGGVFIEGQAEAPDLRPLLRIEDDASISGNHATTGGGIAARDAEVRVAGAARIADNVARAGAGIDVRVDDTVAPALVVLSGEAVVSGNLADADGGGVRVVVDLPATTATVPVTLTVSGDVQITGNRAGLGPGGGSGGGIYVDDHVDVAVELAGTEWDWTAAGQLVPGTGGVRITANSALRGGGMYVRRGQVAASFLVLANNDAEEGGGLFLANDGRLVATNTVISGNAASGLGGGGAALGGVRSRLEMASDFVRCSPQVSPFWLDRYCSELRGNTSAGTGGAIAVARRSTVVLHTTAVMENTSVNGAAAMDIVGTGAFGQSPRVELFSALVADNAVTGGGVNSNVSVTGASFRAAHSSFVEQGLGVMLDSDSRAALVGNVFFDQVNPFFESLQDQASGPRRCNLTQLSGAGLPGPDNVQADPLFVTTERGRFRTVPAGVDLDGDGVPDTFVNSPALDACRRDGEVDLDGEPRPQVEAGAPPGQPAFDRGAFEYDWP